jgi:AraC-like DNA-binding protein
MSSAYSHEHLTLQVVRLQPPEKWVAEPHRLWFVFPNAGRGQYVSRSVTHRLSPGDVLVLNPTSEGEVGSDNGSEFAFSLFAASLEDVFPLFGSREITRLQNVYERLKATRLHGFATALARECHALLAELPPQFNLDHRVHLLRVIAALLGVEFERVPPNLPGFVHAEDHLMQVLERLTTDELMSLSVGELAARFACSRRHLSRLFHQHFGFSVAAMKMEMRLLKAVSLLRDPDVKIISVAESCGFNCLGLFNACFKRRFGITPSQRRKIMVEAQSESDHLKHPGPICPLRSHGMCPYAGYPDNLPPPSTAVEC